MSIKKTTNAVFPIREVSKKTGVNSVTIRAWERRYGLIKPQRTPKGHRLYDENDVEKIHQILTWLDRGIPISQVKSLLKQPLDTVIDESENSIWENYQNDLIQAVEYFNEKKLDSIYCQVLSIYPIDIVSEKIFFPVLQKIQRSWQGIFGNQVIHAFFESNFRMRLSMRLYHSNRNNDQPQLIICNLPFQVSEIPTLAFSLYASMHGFSVNYYNPPAPINEMVMPFEKGHNSQIIFYGDQRINFPTWNALKKLQNAINQPILIAGETCHIHHQEIQENQMIDLGNRLKPAMQTLSKHFKKA